MTDMAVNIMMKSFFSAHHLRAAIQFAEAAASAERVHAGPDVLNTEHRSYVIGGVILGVAFLEAAINEFYIDVSERAQTVSHLDGSVLDTISKLWDMGTPRTAGYRITEKYEIALALCSKPTLRGYAESGKVDAFIALRNALVHYEPEWLPRQSGPDKIERVMKGQFETSRFFKNSGNSFFPDHCLGYGCLRWGINASVAYADRFFAEMGTCPNYQRTVTGGKMPLPIL